MELQLVEIDRTILINTADLQQQVDDNPRWPNWFRYIVYQGDQEVGSLRSTHFLKKDTGSPSLSVKVQWRLMSPTVFRHKNYRFFFFSREEERMHVHVTCPEGEAKFWLEPIVALERNNGLSPRALNELQRIIEEKKNEVIRSWKKHFGR